MFNPDPDKTSLEALQNRLEVLKMASMNHLRYKDVVEVHDAKNLIYDYQKLLIRNKFQYLTFSLDTDNDSKVKPN